MALGRLLFSVLRNLSNITSSSSKPEQWLHLCLPSAYPPPCLFTSHVRLLIGLCSILSLRVALDTCNMRSWDAFVANFFCRM